MGEGTAETTKRARVVVAPTDEPQANDSDGASMTDREVDTIIRRSSRSRQRYRHSVRVRTLKLLLAASIFVGLVGILLLWMQIASVRSEAVDAVARLDKSERQVATLKTALAKVTKERDAMVKGRIPDLTPMVFDRAIQIKRKYVRNIIFTITGSEKKHTYEYRIVLSNGSLSVVNPKVHILLFDGRGIQIGAASVDKVDAITPTDRITLDPGETRSYSSSIPVSGTEHPKYFLLQIQ